MSTLEPVLGRRRSLPVDALQAPVLLVGDETSLGVAKVLDGIPPASKIVLEASDAVSVRAAARGIELGDLEVVARAPGDAHRSGLRRAEEHGVLGTGPTRGGLRDLALRIGVGCLVLLVQGCGPVRPPLAESRSAPSTQEPARPASSTATTPPAPPSDTASVDVTARVVEGEPFTACTAEIRPLQLQGVEIHQTDLPSVGDAVVFAVQRSATARGTNSVLINAASGRHLAELGGVYHGDARLQRAVVAPRGSDAQELLDLMEGSRVRPRITTADGAVQSWRIGLDGLAHDVWVVARTKRGTSFFGPWLEPRDRAVALELPLPFWPESMSDGSGVLVSHGDRSCLLERAGARCFPAIPHAEVLAGRYVVSAVGGGIYDVQSQQEVSLGEGCRWRLAATLNEPPRALLACDDAGSVRWVVWSPQRVLARWTSGDWLLPAATKLDTRVVPLELLVQPDAMVKYWFDLAKARVVVTPALAPLSPQQSFGAQVVVENDADATKLTLLDVEKATLTTLLPEGDCEMPLQWQATSEQQALVACPKPTFAEHQFRPASRLRHYEWLELFDFRARRRMRTEHVFEATLTETGIAVGIRPGTVSTLAALDWPATCTGVANDSLGMKPGPSHPDP